MGSLASSIQPPAEGRPRSWFRDGFFLTTDKAHLDPDVVNEAFNSELMWWNDPLEPKQMQKMLNNCMTVSIFAVPDSEQDMKSAYSTTPRRRRSHEQIASSSRSLLT